MKCVYLSTNGRALAEDLPPNCRLIEEPDGLHPLRPDNVWRNDASMTQTWGPDDSLAVIFQGAASPETWGEGITKEFVTRELVDDFLLKLHDRKQHISKVFWRRLMNNMTTGIMVFMAIGMFAVMGLVLYAVARVVFG